MKDAMALNEMRHRTSTLRKGRQLSTLSTPDNGSIVTFQDIVVLFVNNHRINFKSIYFYSDANRANITITAEGIHRQNIIQYLHSLNIARIFKI